MAQETSPEQAAPGEHTAHAMLVINADPEQIWRTFTDPARVAEYLYGTRLTTDWTVGGPVTYAGEWNGAPYEDRGVVVEVREPLRLVTRFEIGADAGPDPESEADPDAEADPAHPDPALPTPRQQTVTYRIQPIDGGCRVTITQDGNVSKEAAEQSSASWQEILERVAEIAPRA